MPHKRAKRSIREQSRAERKLDLPPSQSTYISNDIPKSMTRVLNAELVQNAWREKKRVLERDDNGVVEGSGKRKKRKTESGAAAKPEIKIKPGETLRHFKRRVEDDMRPGIRSAMKNTSSVSKQKLKQSEKDVEHLTTSRLTKKNEGKKGREDADSESNNPALHDKEKGKNRREPSPDFLRWSSAAPRRLNDIVQAPPELKSAPRLDRLVQNAKKQRSERRNEAGVENEDGVDGVITLQQKRMMELEREKAINRYRALKEARLKERQTDAGTQI